MTFLYKYFGVPGSIDEIVEKLDRTGKVPDVFVRR